MTDFFLNFYFPCSRQICYFTEQFPCDCLANFVQPVAFTLALDKVAEVRITAIRAVNKFFSFSNTVSFGLKIISELFNFFINLFTVG